jgi:2-methylcitrate dehydratase
MLSTPEIAEFVADVSYDRLPDGVREAIKRRILDGVGVSIHTRDADAAATVRRAMVVDGFDTPGAVHLWGSPETTSTTRAAMVNAASIVAGNGPTFLSPTLAPVGGSIAAVLAAADARNEPGEATIAGLAAALELHGELASNVPLDEFHPATHTAIASAAGAGRTMGFGTSVLDSAIGAAASRATLGLDGGTFSAIAAGAAARSGIDACLLAEGGFEGPDPITAENGWHDLVGPFDFDLDPGCERVRDAAVLPYDANPFAHAAISAAIDLAEAIPLDPAEIETVTVETTDRAANSIDPERIATALVDRELPVFRAVRNDVKPIAEAMTIRTENTGFDDSPGESPARIAVETHGGTGHERTVERFDGHPDTPASWGTVEEKFRTLAGDTYDEDRLDEIVETVRGFEAESTSELVRLLD